MNRVARTALALGAAAGALAVVSGAFGAHALKSVLDAQSLSIWHTAVEYQFWHALALLAVAVLAERVRSKALAIAVALFAIGILLFSGSLYLLAAGAPRWTGAVTPFGGVAFIAGWIALVVAALRARDDSSHRHSP